MERLQRRVPRARFVKAFSCVGNALMVNPNSPAARRPCSSAGNDDAAKGDVTDILDQFGWHTEDLGAVEAARAIEPLCILWCIPGFQGRGWSHALKMLR
jgi:predicted dinucleotide-binding enzyme